MVYAPPTPGSGAGSVSGAPHSGASSYAPSSASRGGSIDEPARTGPPPTVWTTNYSSGQGTQSLAARAQARKQELLAQREQRKTQLASSSVYTAYSYESQQYQQQQQQQKHGVVADGNSTGSRPRGIDANDDASNSIQQGTNAHSADHSQGLSPSINAGAQQGDGAYDYGSHCQNSGANSQADGAYVAGVREDSSLLNTAAAAGTAITDEQGTSQDGAGVVQQSDMEDPAVYYEYLRQNYGEEYAQQWYQSYYQQYYGQYDAQQGSGEAAVASGTGGGEAQQLAVVSEAGAEAAASSTDHALDQAGDGWEGGGPDDMDSQAGMRGPSAEYASHQSHEAHAAGGASTTAAPPRTSLDAKHPHSPSAAAGRAAAASPTADTSMALQIATRADDGDAVAVGSRTGGSRDSAGAGGGGGAAASSEALEAQRLASAGQLAEYKAWVVSYAQATLASVDPDYGDGVASASASVPEPLVGADSDVGQLLENMHVAAHARGYIALARTAAEAARDAERAVDELRAVSSSSSFGQLQGQYGQHKGQYGQNQGQQGQVLDVEAFQSAAYAAISALGAALGHADVAAYYAPAALEALPELGAVDAGLEARLARCGAELREAIEAEAQACLDAFHWPPSLSRASAGTARSSTTGEGGSSANLAQANASSSGISFSNPSFLGPNNLRGKRFSSSMGEDFAASFSDNHHNNHGHDDDHDEDDDGDGGDGVMAHARRNSMRVRANAGAGEESSISVAGGRAVFEGFLGDADQHSRLLVLLTCLTSLQAVVERKAFSPLLYGAEGGSLSAHASTAGLPTPRPSACGDAIAPGNASALTSPGGLNRIHEDAAEDGAKNTGEQQKDGEGEGEDGATKDLPLLWAFTLLTRPLKARLLSLFSPCEPAGRLDRPEWMLRLVLALLGTNAPLLEPLQPVVTALGLQGSYHACTEFARCVQRTVLEVMVEERLPAIADHPEAPALWLALSDVAAEYDVALLPHLGLLLPPGAASGGGGEDATWAAAEAVEAVPGYLRRYALLPGAVASRPEWLAAWCAAEAGALAKRLDALLFSDDALLTLEQSLSTQADGGSGADLGADVTVGSGAELETDGKAAAAAAKVSAARSYADREFHPPLMAERALGLLDSVVARSRWLSAHPAAQVQFLEAVGGKVISALYTRIERILEQAAVFGDVLSEIWMAKVCATVCAARYAHHHLSELVASPTIRHLATSGAVAAAAAASGASEGTADADGAAADSSGRGSGMGLFGAAAQSALDALGFKTGAGEASSRPGGGVALRSSPMKALQDSVTVKPSFEPQLQPAVPAVWDAHLRAFHALHRDWCLNIAKELAHGFGRTSVAYRRAIDTNPTFPFTPSPEDDSAAAEADQQLNASSSPGNGNGDDSSLQLPITPAFAPALAYLQGQLGRLSGCLDAPSFRDIWRALALALNRFMFNYIATESRFSRAGARQFSADVSGLVALLRPHTSRPAAHFRELLAAARLLSMSDEDAAEVVRRASAAAVMAANGTPPGGNSPAKPFALSPSIGRSPLKRTVSAAAAGNNPAARDTVLQSKGVACLCPQQIMCVIEHRL